MDRFLKEVAKMAHFVERRLVLFPPFSALKAVGVAFGLTLTLTAPLSAQGTLPLVGRKPGQPLPTSRYPATANPAMLTAQPATLQPTPQGPAQGYPQPHAYPVAQATAQVQPPTTGQPMMVPPAATPGRYAWNGQAMPPAAMTTHGFAVQQAPAPQMPGTHPMGPGPQMTSGPHMGHAPQMGRAPQMGYGQPMAPMQRQPMVAPGTYGPPATTMAQRPPMQAGMMPRMPMAQQPPRRMPVVQHRQPQQPPQAASGTSPIETARQFERQGNVAAAEAQYQSLLAQMPNDRAALVSYARMKHRVGQLPESIQIYQHALQNYPNDPVILNDLGLCFARMGDLPNAITTLRASVGLRPDSQRYRNNLAIVLLETNRVEEAHAVLAEVHGDVLAKYNVSVMLSRRGKTDEARQLLTAIVQAHPEFGPARTMLGELGPAAQPVARVASLPATAGSAAPQQDAAASPKLNLIEPQSAHMDVNRNPVASPAVFHAAIPPEVGSYPIPGVGLEAGE